MRIRAVLLLVLLLCLGARAAETPFDPRSEDLSIFDVLVRTHCPGLDLPDAPTILKESGLTLEYVWGKLPYDERPRPTLRGSRLARRSPLDLNLAFVEMSDVQALLRIAGLDMRRLVADDPEERRAALAALIDPKMDRINKDQILGYDPRLCLNDDGSRVYLLDVDDAVLKDLQRAERLYQRGEHQEYRARLLALLADHPRFSALHVGLANSFFAEGETGQARQWLAQGIRSNPLNPMLHYSLAFCHLADGRRDEAVDALVESVLTCRTNMLSWCALDVVLGADGRRAVDRRFRNHTSVDPNSSLVGLDMGLSRDMRDPWLYYAAASVAVDHERSLHLADFDACDMVDRETYRLLHLLGCYLVLRSQKPDLYDAGLESLEVIRKAGFLREYVIFDRIAPYTQYARTATLTAEGRSQLREYVLRFGISGGNGGPGIK
ncbi:MAG TPA: tetratricopeptide repeat protein [Candidatus Krumholzibacteria bacterium]|nr:tetratricopeptide repeat protein [Candidatus Krumholzibacteria bacterium]